MVNGFLLNQLSTGASMSRSYNQWLVALIMAQTLARAQLPTITNQPLSQAVWVGCNVTFAVGVSGAGPFTYQWQFNGQTLTNALVSTVAGGGTNVLVPGV